MEIDELLYKLEDATKTKRIQEKKLDLLKSTRTKV